MLAISLGRRYRKPPLKFGHKVAKHVAHADTVVMVGLLHLSTYLKAALHGLPTELEERRRKKEEREGTLFDEEAELSGNEDTEDEDDMNEQMGMLSSLVVSILSQLRCLN